MAWDDGQTLATRFERATELAGGLHPHWQLGTSYGGFTAALQARSPTLVRALVQHLQRQMQKRAGAYWLRHGWCAFAADGSRLEGPHTQANEAGLGCAGREKTAPQVFLTTLWHMGLGLPWDMRTGPGTDSERYHLADLLPGLPSHALVVADCGFVGYQLCGKMLELKLSFLLRVGGNIRLLTELGYAYEEREGWVYLWPQEHRDQPPLQLRLIVLNDGEQKVYLLTNILDSARLGDSQAAELYARRWGIEVFYRSFKQTLDHRQLLSRTPETCLCECQWTFLASWLLGMLTVNQLLARGVDPLECSLAKARDAIRRAMRPAPPRRRPRRSRRCGRPLHCRPLSLCQALAQSVGDNYQRRHPKEARNYPRKKKENPPSPPKIRPATPSEIQRAARLRETIACPP